ncbi:MAG: choice-of-anchor J domain-containing protein [Saprospiraceae bacterium]|jgi:hypothetical protein|nr:choice-of-anchor J domain-containing protein [Saprospiraceae bacterium]
MKQLLLLCALLCGSPHANAQFFTIPDTLLIQNFTIDPSDTMLLVPGGNDTHWVNWDADNLPTLCGDEVPVPQNWFWDSDLGDLSDPPVNFAFTSCSFLQGGQSNENWLITPPVFITDSTTVLSWRSASFEGPGYMDGYKVLVSTTTNEPFADAFTDTIFVAAEMLEALKDGSLKVTDYIFSPGYIHANGYTNPDYFFLIHPSAQAYTGRLEPHTASLAKYAGRSIYIAFLHDSTDDNILQLDDIAIVQGVSSGTAEPGLLDLGLRVLPNPVLDYGTVSWQAQSVRDGRLILMNLLGEILLEQPVGDMRVGAAELHISSLPTGSYVCMLRTSEGFQTVLVLKK